MENPIERVYETRLCMGQIKGSLQPLLAFGLLAAVAGLLVKPAQDAMLSLFWIQQSGAVGPDVSILSYGSGVQFGVITDSALCPEPKKIMDNFEPEFTKLTLLALMSSWGE